jgi:DNA polymerase-1
VNVPVQCSEAEALRVLDLAAGARIIAIDTETTSLKVNDGQGWAIGVSIAFTDENGKGVTHYFPFRHVVGENYGPGVLARLKEVIENVPIAVYHNAKFDIVALSTLGIQHQGFFYDTLIIGHLLNENDPIRKDLDSMGEFYLSVPGKVAAWPEGWPDLKKEKVTGWPNTTGDMMFEYATVDTITTFRLATILCKSLHEEGLDEYWNYKQYLIRILIEMEGRGVLVDTVLAEKMAGIGEARKEEIRQELGLNPSSNKDLQKLLIEQLGLPVLKASVKTGAPSFAKDVMAQYDILLERIESPVAKTIKEYRGWVTSVGLCYRPYVDLVSPDGRIRTNYRIDRTVTGRFSSNEPNLQQIPKGSDKAWSGHVKDCFVAKPGFVLLNADYSQLELRLGTAYANEEKLKAVFEEGRDIFNEMSLQLGMSRNDTKTLVYSMQYGAGENRIMTVFGVSQQRAREIRQNYFQTYPRFKALADKIEYAAKSAGEVKLWTGRKRHFKYPKSESFKAMNSVIQGGAADIMERTMIRLYEEVDGPDCLMLLQVHDAVVFEVREDRVEEYSERIKTIMEDVQPDFEVRFAVEVELWSDKH